MPATHHFGSRDALLEAALRFSLERSIPVITVQPGSGCLNTLFDRLPELVEVGPATQAFQYELMLEARRRPELQPQGRRPLRCRPGCVACRARPGRPHRGTADEALVRLLFAALDGLVFQQTSTGDADATRRSLKKLRDVVRLLQTQS